MCLFLCEEEKKMCKNKTKNYYYLRNESGKPLVFNTWVGWTDSNLSTKTKKNKCEKKYISKCASSNARRNEMERTVHTKKNSTKEKQREKK